MRTISAKKPKCEKKKAKKPEPTDKPILVEKLPKRPIKDQEYQRIIHNPKQKTPRLVTFKATGKKKFGKYKIVGNVTYRPKK